MCIHRRRRRHVDAMSYVCRVFVADTNQTLCAVTRLLLDTCRDVTAGDGVLAAAHVAYKLLTNLTHRGLSGTYDVHISTELTYVTSSN